MPTGPLYVLLGEVSVQVLCPSFNWIICLLGVELYEFFIYFGAQTLAPIQKKLCTPMFIAALFTTAKCWKQPRCPSVNKWIKKLWDIYTVEYYATERRIPTLHDSMDGTEEHYAK